MQLIRDIKNITAAEQHCVATIGNFDSVHLGHQKVLQKNMGPYHIITHKYI